VKYYWTGAVVGRAKPDQLVNEGLTMGGMRIALMARAYRLYRLAESPEILAILSRLSAAHEPVSARRRGISTSFQHLKWLHPRQFIDAKSQSLTYH
jgi:hypothetical protein